MKTITAILIILCFTGFKIYSQEFYMCDYVDDSWNPVGSSLSMNGSSGVNFLVKLPEKVYDQLYLWSIYKTDASGRIVNLRGSM